VAEWEVFAGIAARNNTEIILPGGRVPHADGALAADLDDDAILDLVYGTARLPMNELREQRGVIHEDRRVRVVEGDPEASARFSVGPDDVVAELATVWAESTGAQTIGGFDPADFPFRLVSRRMKHVINSLGRELPGLAAVGTTNPAYLHPGDLDRLGVSDGDLVVIESPHGEITGVAASADDVKPGVVSMSHSWGAMPAEDDVPRHGSPTNRLVANDDGYDPITGMAVQSAIPVRITPRDREA